VRLLELLSYDEHYDELESLLPRAGPSADHAFSIERGREK
jgi:hypothetical protein